MAVDKTVLILAENDYEDLELWYPKLRLDEAGVRTVVVGPRAGTYQSKHGYPVEAVAVAEVDAAHCAGVVVPGGYAPDRMRRHPAMVDLVRRAGQDGKVVAAICHAGWMLVSAGLVRGRRVTSFFSIRDDMVNAGGLWVDEPVVVDGNLITSRQPSDLPVFCRAILKALGLASL
ncbi:MAG: type 1 glutamine amidotransferase [Clostridia bacterium]|nr:type 1 glutamine amidotransferase [Clostridia bacterium]